jgi:hypothetical protein
MSISILIPTQKYKAYEGHWFVIMDAHRKGHSERQA